MRCRTDVAGDGEIRPPKLGTTRTIGDNSAVSFWDEVDLVARSLSELNYFDLLGVAPDVDPLAIRDAYFDRLRRFHPDRYLASSTRDQQLQLARICARIGEAYRVLCNAEQRASYKASLSGGRTRMTPARPTLTDSRDPRTEKARNLLASANELAARGSRSAARAKLQLALQFEPESAALQAALEALDAPAPRSQEGG